MAFVPNPDEEKTNTGNTNQILTQPTGAGGNLPTTGGGAAGAPGAAPQGGGFANINQYLAANQPGAAQMGSTIASNLGQEYVKEKSTVDTGAQQAGRAVQAGTPQQNPALIEQAVQNPAQFVSNPANVTAIGALRNAKYTGPGSIYDTDYYSQAAQTAQKGQGIGQLGQSEGGYQQLLTPLETNPTAGKIGLDTALLRSSPEASQAVGGALQPFQNVQNYLASNFTPIQSQVQAGPQTAAQTATATQGTLNRAKSDFENRLTQSNPVIPGLIVQHKAGGLTGQEWQALLKSATHPEDLAREQALSQLSGNPSIFS